ncbi:MAG TPA: cytochrome c oxidase subunit II [Actinomycetota bacterium]
MIRKPERGRTRSTRLVVLAVGMGALLAACAPPTITDSGQKVASLYNIVLVIAIVVFVGVELAIIYNALRYRRHKNDDTLPEQTHGNNRIEVVWTLIPSLIVLALFVMSMVVLADVNHEDPNDRLTVRVTGFQWQWKFEYFKDEAATQAYGVTIEAASQTQPPTLVVPVGERIHFELESADVNHSFYVPEWLFKRDLIPGLHNSFDMTIQPRYAGNMYHGQCAELCGDFHNEMTFEVQTMTSSQFQTWIAAEAKKQAAQGGCSPNGTDLKIDAVPTIKFDTDCLAAPANQAFTIDFTNKDTTGIPHNVALYTKDPTQGGTLLGGATGISDTVTAPGSTTYKVDGLKPGTYYFQCDVHTVMNGQFVVK